MSLHCALVAMTSDKHSPAELRTCWLMSPGGTDTMQISNWKRITQIHHCISARTVAAMDNKCTKRLKKMEEMCSHADSCHTVGVGSVMKWCRNQGAPGPRALAAGMFPMLLFIHAAFSSRSVFSSKSVVEGSIPKKDWGTEARLASSYCHRASVFGDRAISQKNKKQTVSLKLEAQHAQPINVIQFNVSVSRSAGTGINLLLSRCLSAWNTSPAAACRLFLNTAAWTCFIWINGEAGWSGAAGFLLETLGSCETLVVTGHIKIIKLCKPPGGGVEHSL